jgi:CRP-like cAMP-binding protein
MSISDRPTNHLLKALSRRDYNRIAPSLEPVFLDGKQIVYEPKEPIKQIYFPDNTVISILSVMKDGRAVEAGMVGHEGVVGIHALFGISSAPYQYLTVIRGNAHRIKASLLKAELKRGGALQDLLLRYTQARMIQFSQTGVCNCLHTIIERVCRWLLMVHDRGMSDELLLTHEAISQVMRVRRTGITEVAGILQKKRLISYQYGQITILDREGLEKTACECYQIIKDEFTHLLK